MFQVKKEGSKQNKLVSVFRKMFARQISKVQLHRRRLQSKMYKNLKVGGKRSVTTSTFKSKFVLRIGFIVKAWCSMSTIGLIHYNKHDEMFRYKKQADAHSTAAAGMATGKSRDAPQPRKSRCASARQLSIHTCKRRWWPRIVMDALPGGSFALSWKVRDNIFTSTVTTHNFS